MQVWAMLVTSPAPGIPKPKGWQNVQLRRALSVIRYRYPNEQVVRGNFRILDINLEKATLQRTSMPKLKFSLEF